MMLQLHQERMAASNEVADNTQPIVDHILDEIMDQVVMESEDPPPAPVSFSESPGSPVYLAPGIEEEMESAQDQGNEAVTFECMECQLRDQNIFVVMEHLEEDHGLPGEEDVLRMKVREVKIKESIESSEMPDSTTKISDKENNI